MSIEHVSNKDQSNEFPFAYLPSKDTETNQDKVIGTGWESQVKKLGPDWVIKEVNPLNLDGTEKEQELIDYLRNPDRVKKMMADQDRLEAIVGKDHFNKAHLIFGKDQHGKKGYMLVQRFIPGEVVRNLVGTEYASTQEMVFKNRKQFMDIVWGVKKSFIEFGVPLDFHQENIMRNNSTGNFIFIDAGFPSAEYESLIVENTTEKTTAALKHVYIRLNRLEKYESYLKLSGEERDSLDRKYNITDTDYLACIQGLDKIRDSKGITIEIEEEMTLDRFLDEIFGDRQVVSGQEMYATALKILGSALPTESQKVILEEIRRQSTLLGDKAHWKQIIAP